jgi:hypothetical protein
MGLMDPVLVVPASAVVIVGTLIIFRWLIRLQRAMDDHAERITWLEAKTNGKHHRDE